jgi:hypothetical protein
MVALAVVWAGCTSSLAPPSPDPQIVGSVVATDWAGLSVYVRVRRETPVNGVSEVMVRIDPGVTVVARTADGLEDAAATDLRLGDIVAIWHSGVELRSNPPGYFATFVEIRSSP